MTYDSTYNHQNPSKCRKMSFINQYYQPKTSDHDLQLAVQHFQQGLLADALLIASRQCQQLGHSPLPFMLLATILVKIFPTLESSIWLTIWRKYPQDKHIQIALLNSLQQAKNFTELAYYVRMFLPDSDSREEQLALGQYLLRHNDKKIGVCRQQNGKNHITIMASETNAPYVLTLKNCHNGETLNAQSACYNEPFELPLTDKPGIWEISFADTREPLIGSPVANYDNLHQAIAPLPDRSTNPHCQISIIIPVYKSFELTVACIESVCKSLAANVCQAEVIVINDSADGKNLRKLLSKQAQSLARIINHDSNCGFIESVNHAIALSAPGNHILLLNADTRVSGNWLDRLSDSLNQAPDIASVSPLSNNGEISSIPQIGKAAPMPDEKLLKQINQQLGQIRDNGESEDIATPAVCGFCMLIHRTILDEIGGLDGKSIRRGYSEEVDWCLRATYRGYRHMLATAVYVAHEGGASFSREKHYLVTRHRQLILQRYPDYYRDYFAFLAEQPLAGITTQLEKKLGKRLPVPTRKDQAEWIKLPALPPLAGKQAFIAIDLHNADDHLLTTVLAVCRQLASRRSQLHCILLGHAPEVMLATGIATTLLPEHHSQLIHIEDLLLLLDCRLLISNSPLNLPGRTLRHDTNLSPSVLIAHIDHVLRLNNTQPATP